ncbi:MAG: hypothetical protein AABZ13_08605 [Planctomycetota bacterium]
MVSLQKTPQQFSRYLKRPKYKPQPHVPSNTFGSSLEKGEDIPPPTAHKLLRKYK